MLGKRAMSEAGGGVSICLVSSVTVGFGSISVSLSLFNVVETVARNSKSEMSDSFAEHAYSIGDRQRSSSSFTEWKLKKSFFVPSEQSLHALNSPSDVSLSGTIRFVGIPSESFRIDIACIIGNEESPAADESVMFIPEIPEILVQILWSGS
jgi:hypothetical protein